MSKFQRLLTPDPEEKEMTDLSTTTPHTTFVISDAPFDSSEKPQVESRRRCLSVRSSRFETGFKIFIAGLVVFNVVVIAVSIWAITSRGENGECEGKEEREVVAPLCLPCEDWMEEEGEEGGWRRFKDGDSLSEMCCPLDYQHLASAVGRIYNTTREAEKRKYLEAPPEPYSSFLYLDGEPATTDQTVVYANRYKPSGHLTGVQRFDANKYFQPTGQNDTPGNDIQTVGDWPLRVEPYRSTTTGYVKRLTWGLGVPTSGLYRIHSSINFFFPSWLNSKGTANRSKEEHIRVLHQISRYHAKDRQISVLADRNQTISSRHSDGLTSFLVTLAELDIGDVIFISVSHRSAIAMQDRWHSEGLFLVQ